MSAGIFVGVVGTSTDFNASATKIEPRRPPDFRLDVLSPSLVGVTEPRLDTLSLFLLGVLLPVRLTVLILVGVFDIDEMSALLCRSDFFLFITILLFIVHLTRAFDFLDCYCGVSKMFYLAFSTTSKFMSNYLVSSLIELAKSKSTVAMTFLDSASRSSIYVILLINELLGLSKTINVFKDND